MSNTDTAHTIVTLRIEDDIEIGHDWTGAMGDERVMAALHELHIPMFKGRIEKNGRKYSVAFQSLLTDGSGVLLGTHTWWTDETATAMIAALDRALGEHATILPFDLRDDLIAIEDAVLRDLEDEA